MGLSICRAIIQTHGGRLWATSDAPQGALQGTTLQFTLPAGTDNGL
jgi:signal transduction histidine kinase